MTNTGSEANLTILTLVRWGEEAESVRAMILTSSRAVPGAPVDEFSDYDIILVLNDIRPFFEDAGWLGTFGRVLANYRDPLITDGETLRSACVTLFEDGLRIDFTLWPVTLLREIAASEALPPELDAGYRVLLDKDGLTETLRPPVYRGYIPAPPTETEFRAKIESFFLDALYVAKCLRRGERIAARHVQETHMKQEHLIAVLEWLGQIEHGWKLNTGPHGRRMETWLRPDLQERLDGTYTGLAPLESRDAFFRTFDLFCSTAIEVAGQLGYAYPHDLEERIRMQLDRFSGSP